MSFTLLAPGSLALVALPLAGLLLAAGPARPLDWVVAALLLALGARLVVEPGSRADALVSAFVVLASAAFVCLALVQRATPLRMATRAIGWGGAATLLLCLALWDGIPWQGLLLEVSHEVRGGVPGVAAMFMTPELLDRSVEIASRTLPALLVLAALAGFALAWQLHVRLARRPLGAPLAPFREFRFGDPWVWGVIAAVTVWLVPALTALRPTALNLGVVLGVLYALRGAAVIAALAGAAGVSSGALVLAAVLAALLAVPLLLLWILGLTDTWLEYRRRLAGRPTHS